MIGVLEVSVVDVTTWRAIPAADAPRWVPEPRTSISAAMRDALRLHRAGDR